MERAEPLELVIQPVAATRGCCARTVVRNDGRLVPANGAKVHWTRPDISGWASGPPKLTCTVGVPLQLLKTNEVGHSRRARCNAPR